MTGKVKWWNDSKGYGFIAAADGTDVFVHFTNLVMEGFKTLMDGQDVEFDVYVGSKGLEAKNVRVK